MEAALELLLIFASFAVLALASKQIGDYFAKYDLPLITGFLVAGILIGPYALGLLSQSDLEKLRFVDEMALAVIALAAGSELYLRELRSRIGAIVWVTLGQIVITLAIGAWAMWRLSGMVQGFEGLGPGARLAIALLMGVILLARSPSSTIAVISELRAKGPLTQLALGVTVVKDVMVIALFAIVFELSRAWVMDAPLGLGFLLVLLVDLALSAALGYGLLYFFIRALTQRWPPWLKGTAVLFGGYGVFVIASAIERFSSAYLGVALVPEPLLAGLLAAFLLVNKTPLRDEFVRLLEALSPAVYIAFFTLTGASLALDVLLAAWPVALALFAVRLLGVFLGSFAGGLVAGDPLRLNAISWMAFITQAGVALGLAKKVADAFPAFGEAFATVVVALVVLNQVVGPPLFKKALRLAGETHTRGPSGTLDDARDAIVFGDDDQALALARRLAARGWSVKLASPDPARVEVLRGQGLTATAFRPGAFSALDPEGADAVVAMLKDEENLEICRHFYEEYGLENLVVRYQGRVPIERFQELGCMVVDPTTATVHLLAQFVESPGGAAIFLGLEEGQRVVDVEMRDPALDGVPLRELRLPADVLVLAIHRGHEAIVTHGYTQLRLGDRVTLMGSPESLEEVMVKLGAP